MEDVLSVTLNPGLWKFPALLKRQGRCLCYAGAAGIDGSGVVNKSGSQLSARNMYVCEYCER